MAVGEGRRCRIDDRGVIGPGDCDLDQLLGGGPICVSDRRGELFNGGFAFAQDISKGFIQKIAPIPGFGINRQCSIVGRDRLHRPRARGLGSFIRVFIGERPGCTGCGAQNCWEHFSFARLHHFAKCICLSRGDRWPVICAGHRDCQRCHIGYPRDVAHLNDDGNVGFVASGQILKTVVGKERQGGTRRINLGAARAGLAQNAEA